jgi:hypothetical protein
MTDHVSPYNENHIQSLIVSVRGQKVILDSDLAAIFKVETKRLNEAVKRNISRFPEDFAFRLNLQEVANLKSQIATSSFDSIPSVSSLPSSHGGRRKLPMAFTEHGAIMAANVLNSPRAVHMSVFVVRAFVRMRSILGDTRVLARRLNALEKELKQRQDIHESAIVSILQRFMDVLDPPVPHKPPARKRIGFTVKERSAAIGLSGIYSQWRRGKLNFSSLSKSDAEKVAIYGLHELNGFPAWFPELASSQPEAVQTVLSKCILGEWQIPAERLHVHEVLSTLFWSGDFYWHLIAEELMKQLLINDPKHIQVLEDALSILVMQPNPPLSKLAILAANRVRDYQSDSLFFMVWMILWIQLDAIPALHFLQSSIDQLDIKDADELILRLCDGLGGRREHTPYVLPKTNFLEPTAMRVFVPLIYRHIRPKEDIDRSKEGAYTPTSRDDAQHFRDGLLQRLAVRDHPEVHKILTEIADLPEIAPHRDMVLHLIDEHILQIVDLAPWQAGDIPAFASEFETDPRSDSDLFRIARWRMLDIKYEVERSENSLRDEVQKDWDESALRRWLQRKLTDRSRSRYTIPQEVEIDQGQRPDLHFECPGLPPVPVEIKWADKKWTANDLLERLENQLVGQYLRARNVRFGIYVVGYHGRKNYWNHPTEANEIGFDEVVKLLEKKAVELERGHPGIAGVQVISINFTRSA